MSRVLQLVGTDLRRLKFWLVTGVGVLLLVQLFGVALLYLPRAEQGRAISDQWRLLSQVATGLEAARLALAFMIGVVLVRGDKLVGETAFWLTRPIAGARLLLAKAVVAFLVFGVLPVVISLPWWLWCGLTAGQVSAAATPIVVGAFLAALPGMAAAALTDSLSRALLWGVLGSVCCALLLGGAATVLSTGLGGLILRWELLAAAAAGFAIAWGVQYLRRSIGWAVFGGLAAVLAAVSYVVLTSSVIALPATPMHEEKPKATGQVARATVERLRGSNSNGWRVRLGVRASDIPPGRFVHGGRVAVRWQWHGGPNFGVAGSLIPEWSVADMEALGYRDNEQDAAMATWVSAQNKRAVAAGRRVGEAPLGPKEVARNFTVIADVPAGFAGLLGLRPSRCSVVGEARLAAVRLLVGEPIQSREWTARRARGFRVARVDWRGGGLVLDVRETFLSRHLLAEFGQFVPPLGNPRFVGLDRERSQFWKAGEERVVGSPITVNSVQVYWNSVRLPIGDADRETVEDRVRLAQLYGEDVGSYRVDVHEEGFLPEPGR